MSEQKLTNPALEKIVRILDLLTKAARPLNGAQIAKQLDLPRSSVHGLLNGMLVYGLIRKSGDGGFTPGTHLMYWANGFLATQDIVADFQQAIAAMPALDAYTLTLSVLTGDQVMYLACRNSTSPLGFIFRAGMRFPAVLTATGKAILATFSDEEVRQIVTAFPEPLTDTSVRTQDGLLEELAQTRARGYAVDNGQLRLGMYCFGTALADMQGQRYGIAVSLTEKEADETTVRHVAGLLKQLAEKLENGLGRV